MTMQRTALRARAWQAIQLVMGGALHVLVAYGKSSGAGRMIS
jgi:hypothetical protein